MKMSTKGRYGLRLMMELASNYGHGPMLVDSIAATQDISGKYIHVLVGNLRSAGLVRAVRGPKGGYELARKPSEITAHDVIMALEGKSAPVACVTDPSACSRSSHCTAREVWCEVASAIDGVLSGMTLENLAARQREKKGDPLNYII